MTTPRDRARQIFTVSVLVTAILYVVPFGRTLAWPLVLVSTLAHELAHGLTAALLGGTFHSLRIYADASGAALWSGAFGRVATAMVAGAGLLGPAASAFVLLMVGREQPRARALLGIGGASLIAIAVVLVRNPFGLVFTLLLGSALLFIAVRVPRASQTAVILLAVQLALSVFARSDYLFTPMAITSTGLSPSDVAVMSEALFLPYWFWGALCAVLSVLFLFLGVRLFFRQRSSFAVTAR
jgi:Peptidase M50B-like